MATSWWVRGATAQEKEVTLTKEQVEALSQFEGKDKPFTTALDAGYTRAIPRADLELMSRVYHEAKGTQYKLHTGCSRCVFNFIKEVATMYRRSAAYYEEQLRMEEEILASEEAEREAQRKAERNAKDRARRAARKAAKQEEGK